MKILVRHVTKQLEERGFCVVFQEDLERCWPSWGSTRSERESSIQAFAESQGWVAEILEGEFGTRAIFSKTGTGWLS